MRRRFHGSRSIDGSFQMRECKPGEPCSGRSHFYVFDDHDAEALFDLLDEHHRKETP